MFIDVHSSLTCFSPPVPQLAVDESRVARSVYFELVEGCAAVRELSDSVLFPRFSSVFFGFLVRRAVDVLLGELHRYSDPWRSADV